MNILLSFLFPLFGYLSGSLPFSIWVTRYVKNVDVRDAGSGHATTSNTIGQAGPGWAALVLILDLAKGFIPTYLALHVGQNEILSSVVPLTAACAVIGHCWPIFAQFRGGMGLATCGGALLAINWISFGIAFGFWLILMLAFRHPARASALTGIFMAPLFWLFNLRGHEFWVAMICGIIIASRFLVDWNRTYSERWLNRGQS